MSNLGTRWFLDRFVGDALSLCKSGHRNKGNYKYQCKPKDDGCDTGFGARAKKRFKDEQITIEHYSAVITRWGSSRSMIEYRKKMILLSLESLCSLSTIPSAVIRWHWNRV